MNGIVGIGCLNGDSFDPQLVETMLLSIHHRGPDASGSWCNGHIGLGQNILWTTPESLNERVPVYSHDADLALVADARIDNRTELIKELDLNDRPSTQIADGQLILEAYQKWGQQCPSRLLGDFAFIVWDRKRERFFCARDHIGVRSLYYSYKNHQFAIASEIKALFEAPWVRRELNEVRLAEHLASAFDDPESTFFDQIFRLPAAHSMVVDRDGLRLQRYWSLNPERELRLNSDQEYEETFRAIFNDAIQCRLRSAFPVGSTLSGGLDSSSITCIARELLMNRGERLHTFSAIFPGLPPNELRQIDERRYVDQVVALGNLESHKIKADRLNPIGDLDTILWHQDDPLIPFNLYMHIGIFRAAHDLDVRVLLDGFDGDTTISHGYELLAQLAKDFHWCRLIDEAKNLNQRPSHRQASLKKILWVYSVLPLLKSICPPTLLVRRALRGFTQSEEPLINKQFAEEIGMNQRMRELLCKRPHRFHSARHAHGENLESHLIPYALDLLDKTAAAHSIETRFPFFDKRLIEFCLALPADQKFRQGWTRSILRRALQDTLPAEIQWRVDKANLSPNFYRNLFTYGKSRLDQIIEQDIDNIACYVNTETVKAIYSRFVKHPSNRDATVLFLVLNLAVWARNLVNRS